MNGYSRISETVEKKNIMISKKKFTLIIIPLIVLLIITGGLCINYYFFNIARKLWFEEKVTAQEKEYTVKGWTVGEELWDYNVNAEIAVFGFVSGENTVLADFTSRIKFGDTPSEKNYNLEATDEYIKILLFDCNGACISSYRFDIEDFEKSDTDWLR